MHIFAPLGHICDSAFLGPPSIRDAVAMWVASAVAQNRPYSINNHSRVACFSMINVDPDRRRPDGTPFCMPAALGVGRRP